MNSKWHIGQKIIVIKTHPQSLKNGIIKGVEFTIQGLRLSLCKCKEIDINIGKCASLPLGHCSKCDIEWPQSDGVWWFSEKWFAPIDENTLLSEYTTESLLSEIESLTHTKQL